MSADSNMIDVILANEQKNTADRIAYLEKRVHQQNDELICLKSALADVIRRLQHVEGLQQQQQNHITNQTHKNVGASNVNGKLNSALSKQQQQRNKDTQEVTTVSVKQAFSNGDLDLSQSNNVKQSSKSARTGGENKTTKESVSSSVDTQISSRTAHKKTGHHQATGISGMTNTIAEHVIFNSDSGLIKLFLRGRPVIFYLSSKNQVSVDSNDIGYKFDIEARIPAPKENLKLEWVYGYRGKDCRSNLYQLSTGEIVYFIAATVVLYNTEERSQRHYLGHTDDVKAIAVHPDKLTIASGQATGHDKQGCRAHVRIWDSVNLVTLKVIGTNSNEFQNAVCCLSFSKTDSGALLAVVDDSAERWLSVWNWQSASGSGSAASEKPAHKLACTKCHNDLVFAAEFHPTEKNLIITCGKQHIFFWQLDSSTQLLTKRAGIFELTANAIVTNAISGTILSGVRAEKPKYVLCCAFASNGDVISGDSEGNILFWNIKEAKICRIIKEAHEGGIFSIFVINNADGAVSMVTGGGKDGKLCEWTQEFSKTSRTFQIPEMNGAVRFITNGKGNQLLIGTTRNCVFQASFDLNYLNCIVNGHVEELWGLTAVLNSTHSSSDVHFLTCSNDKLLIYWDILSHSMIWSAQLDDQLHCVHTHPNFDLAAIGMCKPKWIVFDLTERKTVFSQLEGSEQIECIQYSPNGVYLACGSRDNYIYVYSVSENGLKYSRVGKCVGHSSFITHIDWSTDSEYLMSNSGDYEILFWHAPTCKQVTQVQQIREFVWKTNNCTLSLNTLGIWNSYSSTDKESTSMDGTDVNACAASRSGHLLSSVDDFGKVNLFSYPCKGAKAEKRVYQGHSSHVTNVTFINNDMRLITIGGHDTAIFQWAIQNE